MTKSPRFFAPKSRLQWLTGWRLPVVLVCSAIAFSTYAESDKSDCQCRAPGGDMKDLGTVQCVDIVGTKNLVRCEMSQNTPYWKKVEGVEGCPSA